MAPLRQAIMQAFFGFVEAGNDRPLCNPQRDQNTLCGSVAALTGS
jgi:hypothetical protein